MKIRGIFYLLVAVGFTSCQADVKWQRNKGFAHGTFYSVTYAYDTCLIDEIEEVINQTDRSLSTFDDSSVISLLNSNASVAADSLFADVFERGRAVWQATSGAFDITVAPLVNAWGFGFAGAERRGDAPVDSLLALVGYDNVTLAGGEIAKQDPRIMLDASAIAKGYSVDRVARYLEWRGVRRYMVEIGGELRVRGSSPSGTAWRIGVERPGGEGGTQAVLNLEGGALATSGNYRQFYEVGGKRYAHTIDPRTGRPAQRDLLSATVWARECVTADAYATAFMVLGADSARAVADADPTLEALFIVADTAGRVRVEATRGMAAMMPR